MAEQVKTMTDELVDESVAHSFTKNDWYDWAGCSKLPDGSGPFISNHERYTVLLSGPTDGYIEPGSDIDCGIQVVYFVDDDLEKDEMVAWDRQLPNYLENLDGYVRLYNSMCRMMNDESLPENVVDSFCSACGFEKIL